ncbi:MULTISPECIES: regulatory protein YcgZ [Erwinia]|uniref:regulatory protein YcgZ n=1 Tax=Erwinia TaxID=551 RepID=UPI000552C377|nr:MULTISPECIES: regulatory protein YcgZ [Erwinia]
MRQDEFKPKTEHEIARYFSMVDQAIPSHQDTLGQIVMEIIKSGKPVNRKAICSKLLMRLEHSSSAEMEKHHHELIGILFGRDQ